MEFIKAFDVTGIDPLTLPISKIDGALWLFKALLFLITASWYFFDVHIWPFLSILTFLISQILIISVWSDTPFSTIANVLVLLISLPALGNFQFHGMVEKDQ